MKRTHLILSNGEEYAGYGFGAEAPYVSDLPRPDGAPKGGGEVVFNTAMSGYHEVLTDPSYSGQIVALTYPHAGNYGCNEEWNEVGPEDEADRPVVKPAGLVVREVYDGPVPTGRISLDAFLKASGTPGISGVDTRRLTLDLRDEGSRNGVIIRPREGAELTAAERESAVSYLGSFPRMEGRDLVDAVGISIARPGDHLAGRHIALLDCGIKANIVRILEGTGCRLTLLESSASAADVDALGPDALFVSNGPGDPAVLEDQVDLIRKSIGVRPVLGICLGHQLIAQALGAKTYKMKFGHHGVNHPVRDESSGAVFVTSQNHGFAVDDTTLPEGTEVWLRNANDATNEGIRSKDLRVLTTQFHPEAAPGPRDALWIFERFLQEMA